MPYKNLLHFISALESSGELVRIKEFVSPKLEITEVTDRISKHGGPALLFENTGTDFPLLINAFGSEKRTCLALGVERLDDIRLRISSILEEFLAPKERFLDKLKTIPLLRELSSWMPGIKKGRGACQEVVMDPPDLTKFPVLTCWPADGGPFITLPCVHTVDPTGNKQLADESWHTSLHHGAMPPRARNLGMYRMQVFGPALTGMHWHMHKGSAGHFRQYRALGQLMPVSVTLGGDPVYTYVATAPLPEGLDEYLLAGFLRRKRVELVRCLTNDLEVPADVDIVIEGYVDPSEDLILEGPFGDHTGFYSLAGYFPRFHVTCITHRKNAIYPATIVGIPPQEDGWIGKATERIFLTPLKLTVAPELSEMHMPVEGVFHNLALAGIVKSYPGQAEKVMNALWGAGQMMFNKILVITAGDVDLTDYRQVARAVTANVDPRRNILFNRGPADVLDHASREYASGSKMGIDATGPAPAPAPSRRHGLSSRRHGDLGVLSRIPDLVSVNDTLLEDDIGILIVSFRKTKPGHARSVAGEILNAGLPEIVRFLVLVDEQVDPADIPAVVWLGANNIDPVRDCFIPERIGEQPAILFIDATRKSMELDGFDRDWPNITLMDRETILTVDAKWPVLGLGTEIASPSDRYRSLAVREGPVW